MNHIQLQRLLWAKQVDRDDIVIDATCGNGHDTEFLASLGVKKVYALDIQKEAIEASQKRVEGHISWHLQCHSSFPEEIGDGSVSLIVYNLGYLPGSDKTIQTAPDTTVKSVQEGLKLLKPGGMLSVTLYTGHPQGKEEEGVLLAFVEELPKDEYRVQHTRWLNYQNHPSLLCIYRADILGRQ